ncbi:hypothetical protein Hanom_Chr12g01155171 [Helianthus anomalus]
MREPWVFVCVIWPETGTGQPDFAPVAGVQSREKGRASGGACLLSACLVV